jgi:hypothetical protein
VDAWVILGSLIANNLCKSPWALRSEMLEIQVENDPGDAAE